MGLIKTGIYAGTAYAIFNKASKAYGEHERTSRQQPQQLQFQQPSGSRSVSPAGANDAEYVHMHFCNGQCQNQCNPTASAAAGGAAQYYSPAPQQQRAVEYGQEPLPAYGSSGMGMGKKDFGDLASMAERFMKK